MSTQYQTTAKWNDYLWTVHLMLTTPPGMYGPADTVKGRDQLLRETKVYGPSLKEAMRCDLP